jgi:hypothetical protein
MSIFNTLYFKQLFQFLLFILLLSSCATNPAIHRGQKFINIPQVKSIGIVSDICLARDNLTGDDYFSIKDSKLAESYILETTKKHLEQKGYKVNFTVSPFVCSFKPSNKAFKVAKKEGANVSDAYSPFYIAELFDNDKEYESALKNIMTLAHKSTLKNILIHAKQKNSFSSKLFLSNKKIQESLKIIAERTNTEMLLILTGEGEIVSASKSVTQGLATGLLTTALTLALGGGMIVTNITYEVSYLNTYLNLIDIKNNQLLWLNFLNNKNIDPIDRKFYLGKWSDLLSPIPDRNKRSKVQKIKSAKDDSLIKPNM